eukprot:TRINITY_DN24798_c0_g1_i1.p1 TRINITY_DN24798_c0_g1~~TRINITY_DN24798_c0_g1_i1.p1  ORF type:complete len:512 (+),score=118.98 TRINITY_DN24798_c0_g1_i1:67-1602(+)
MLRRCVIRRRQAKVMPSNMPAAGIDPARDRTFMQTGDVAAAITLQRAHDMGQFEATTSAERGARVEAELARLDDSGFHIGRAAYTTMVELIALVGDYARAREHVEAGWEDVEELAPALLPGLLTERLRVGETWLDGVEADLEMVLALAYQNYKRKRHLLTARTAVAVSRTLCAFQVALPAKRLWHLLQQYCELHTFDAAQYTRAVNAYLYCFPSLSAANRFLEKQLVREKRFLRDTPMVQYTMLWLCRQGGDINGLKRHLSVLKNKKMIVGKYTPRPPAPAAPAKQPASAQSTVILLEEAGAQKQQRVVHILDDVAERADREDAGDAASRPRYQLESLTRYMYLECLCNSGSWDKAWSYYERSVRVMKKRPCVAFLSLCARNAAAHDDEWAKRAEDVFRLHLADSENAASYHAWLCMFQVYAAAPNRAKADALMAMYIALGMFPFRPAMVAAYAPAASRSVEETFERLYQSRHAGDFYRRHSYTLSSVAEEPAALRGHGRTQAHRIRGPAA